MHALSFPDDIMWLDHLPWPREWPRLVQLEADEYLNRQKGRLEGPVFVRTRVESGSPVRTIVRVAAEEKADMILLATRPRKRLSLGRVAHQLVELAPCPVLLAPVPDVEPMEKAFEEFKV